MREPFRFTDLDLRKALRHKYDHQPVSPLSEEFMAKVMQRLPPGNTGRTAGRFRRDKVLVYGIAASIVIGMLVTAWMYVGRSPVTSGKVVPTVSLSEEPVREPEPVAKVEAMAEPRAHRPQRTNIAFKARPAALKADVTLSVALQETDTVASPQMYGEEDYTQETRDLLSTRFDMGRQQIEELRAELAR
ncbi:MAG: hypothetical protein J6K41_00395 [Paraprevotella sp.]|nr:hypothetical protein [Paraprevotella sp.]